MSIEARLSHLANHVRDLLGCDEASLLLSCPDPLLRHPLLTLFPRLVGVDAADRCYGSSAAHKLLHDERVEALCDMALQTGLVWCMDYSDRPELPEKMSLCYPTCSDEATFSPAVLLAAPLERPLGMLGSLLLADARPGAFQRGDHLLIEQYLPTVACRLEQALAEICSTHALYPPRTPTDAAQAVSVVQEQGEFVAMISHELRLPLTAIKGYAALLQAYGFPHTPAQPEEEKVPQLTVARQQHYLDVIMQQTNHLEVLIGDLLDVSRIQAGRLTLRRSSVDITQLCQYVAQLVQYRVDQQQPGRYAIRCSLEPDLPPAWTDTDRVQQVLTNLLENAVKYSPAGGLIEVLASTCPPASSRTTSQAVWPYRDMPGLSTPPDALMTYVTVRDHGIGISQRQQSSLFKPFTRLAHPATANVSGVGLGLYISRKLIEALDGHLVLESREGEGTSVTFALPGGPSDRAYALYSPRGKVVSEP